ncbi:MAG TPA: hypothetical protein VFQ91_08350 [Bryobacteraceae bacterium]|nr:hypothetical protein [Bryobacteraceae bacterium]
MYRLFLLTLLCGAASAQSPFTCTRLDMPGAVRAEGLAELIPDIIIECTGGTPGAGSSSHSLLVTVQGAWATRPPFTPPVLPGSPPGTVMPSTPLWNEAMLLIDDPAPQDQIACLPAITFNSCSAGGSANIFPARRLENNLIGFTDIPLSPPGAGKTRRLRIANLRVNAPLSAAKAGSISTAVQLHDYRGDIVPIAPREAVSAVAQASYSMQLLDARGGLVNDISPALLASPAAVPLNAPIDSLSFYAVFAEGTETAFRRRNVATTPAIPGSVQSQNIPGLLYNTESGFFDTRLPLTSALSVAGSADSGTRLRLNIENIPKNILVWVSIRDAETGTRNYDADNPKALLTYSNPNGDGPFSPVSPYIPGWSQIYVDGGKAQAVWEIVSADPTALDRVSFRIALTSQGSAGTGAATLRGSIAPFLEGTTTTALSVVPRFQVPATNVAAFTLTNSLQTAPAAFTSAASFAGASAAPGAFTAGFAANIASTTASAPYPWPTSLNGIQVQLIDATGISRYAPILLVSPGQVNFLMPPEVAPGPVLINLIRQGLAVASGLSNIQNTSPGLFSADGTGRGLAAGTALRLTSSGSNPAQPLALFNSSSNRWEAVPIPIHPDEPVYLSLYATGIRNRRGEVTATAGGQPIPVIYAGPQSDLPGLDQINLGPLPASLRGRGDLELVVRVDGSEANRIHIAVE